MLNGSEASLPQRSYPRDSSSLTVVRMTYVSFRTEADRLSVRNLMLFVWDSSLRSRYVQNDSCLLLLSRRKEVTKKGRPLVIGYSRPLLRSLSGAAELAPLKQSSPSFRLLPRSRQPDKCGHACALCACKATGNHRSEVFLCCSNIIPNRGRRPSVRNPNLFMWGIDSSFRLRCIQNDSVLVIA